MTIPFSPEEAKDLADALGVALVPGGFTTWSADRTCITGVCGAGLILYALLGAPASAWSYDDAAYESDMLTPDEVWGIADGFDKSRWSLPIEANQREYKAGHAWGARLRALAGLDGEVTR